MRFQLAGVAEATAAALIEPFGVRPGQPVDGYTSRSCSAITLVIAAETFVPRRHHEHAIRWHLRRETLLHAITQWVHQPKTE